MRINIVGHGTLTPMRNREVSIMDNVLEFYNDVTELKLVIIVRVLHNLVSLSEIFNSQR